MWLIAFSEHSFHTNHTNMFVKCGVSCVLSPTLRYLEFTQSSNYKPSADGNAYPRWWTAGSLCLHLPNTWNIIPQHRAWLLTWVDLNSGLMHGLQALCRLSGLSSPYSSDLISISACWDAPRSRTNKIPPEIELPGEEKHSEQMTQAWEGTGEWQRETARPRKRKWGKQAASTGRSEEVEGGNEVSDQAETIRRNADLCRGHGEGQDPEVEEHVLRMRKQQRAAWIMGQSELGRGAGTIIRANGSKTFFIRLIKKMSFSFTICKCSLGLDKGRGGQRACQCGMEPGLSPQQSVRQT